MIEITQEVSFLTEKLDKLNNLSMVLDLNLAERQGNANYTFEFLVIESEVETGNILT